MRNKDLTIYGDGSQTRTFCFVEDNIDATVLAITNDMWINDVVNIGSNIEMQIIDLAKLVIKVINSKSSIIHLPPLKEGDMTRRKPDTSKMMEVLGCNLTPLEEGIKLTAQFLKNNY